MDTDIQRETGFRKSVSLFSCAVSGLALVVFSVSHFWRADALMMATVFPVFVWLISGLFVSMLVSFKRWRIGLLIAWLLAAFFLGDSPISMVRGLIPVDADWQSARESATGLKAEQGTPIRVVTINCLSNIRSLKECLELDPDVVLLQESPSRKQVLDLSTTEFSDYSVVWSGDASLFVKGSVNPFPVPQEINGQYVLATVGLKNGAKFNVGSTRLIPSVLRFDLWNVEAWSEFADNRADRRVQLQMIYDQIKVEANSLPTIFGGDFNAPARDAIFEILKPVFHDSFVQAGRGWGKTIVNEYPAQRIDQVWCTEHFNAVSVTAKKTKNSDHRMVISDLWLK